MDICFPASKVVKTLGDVVGLVEERPVVKSVKAPNLLAGKTAGYLDLRLENIHGEEMVVRVPVEPEVLAFYRK